MVELVDRAELLARIRVGYASFQALLEKVTPAQMVEPNTIDMWSIKDCLAHLIVHERFALRELDQALRGEAMPYDERDTESINADAVISSQRQPLEAIRAEWQQSFEQVLETIGQLSDDDFESGSLLEKRLGDTVDGAFGNNTYLHYAEHEQMVRAWLERQGTSAS